MELVQKSVGSLEASMLTLDNDALSLKEQVWGQLGDSLESWLLFDDQICITVRFVQLELLCHLWFFLDQRP